MKGSVLGFDPDTNTGAVSGFDGRRYDFVRLEWRSPAPPARGAAVDFIPVCGRATQIYPAAGWHDPAEGEAARIVYVLYLAGLLFGVTGLIGVVMAYVNRKDAPDWVGSHYRLQIRTFWIGLLYGLLSVSTAIILVGLLFAGFTLVWWIVRCAKGLKLLAAGAPYDRPATWLW
jgi:uncharacterized membrane protein